MTSAAARAEEAMRRAQASERANGLAGAVAAMSEAVELDPDSMKYRGLRGRLFSMQENWRAAIADFDSVLAAKPDAPSVRYSRGRARAMLDDLDGAIADFEYCTTPNRRQPMPWPCSAPSATTAVSYRRSRVLIVEPSRWSPSAGDGLAGQHLAEIERKLHASP